MSWLYSFIRFFKTNTGRKKCNCTIALPFVPVLWTVPPSHCPLFSSRSIMTCWLFKVVCSLLTANIKPITGASLFGNIHGEVLTVLQIFSVACDWSKCITWLNMPQLKLGNTQVIFPNNFQNCMFQSNICKIINTIASNGQENIFLCSWGYLYLDLTSVPQGSQFPSSFPLRTLFAPQNSLKGPWANI